MKYLVCIALLSCLNAAPASASNSLNSALKASILSEIERFGSSSVIVEYAEVPALSALSGESRKAEISNVHQRFVGSLSPITAQAIGHAFAYVAGAVMSVNVAQLEEISRSPLVKRVYKNEMRRLNLKESVGLIFPGNAKTQYSGKGQAIAVLDTGVDSSHDFFTANGINRIVSEACYSGGGFTEFSEVVELCPNRGPTQTGTGSGIDCTAFNLPGCDHGTHVAGIAAGNEGVANEASLIAIQVFTGIRGLRDICGPQLNCVVSFDSDLIRGLERVYELRTLYNIAAVNMSLGGGQFFSSCNSRNPLMTRIISRLKSAGIATIVASGNDGFSTSIGFPACIANTVAVGATSDFDGVVSGRPVSKDERVFYSNHSELLDLFAPGTLIRSSVPDNRFADFNGTSMAAPHVAGAFAVIKAEEPSLSVNLIQSTFKSIGPKVSHSGITRRRIDITAALKTLDLFNLTFPVMPMLSLLLEDPAPPPVVCNLPTIMVGETKQGNWNESSPLSANRLASYSQPFAFELTESTPVIIDLTSAVDTHLYLMQGCDASGPVLEENDDGGVGFNSRIARTLAPGFYTIDPTTFDGATTASFSLSLSN